MSTRTHSLGPWNLDKENTGIGEKYNIVKIGTRTLPDGKEKQYSNHIAQVWEDDVNADADAHLIAAAPDLLQALDKVQNFLRSIITEIRKEDRTAYNNTCDAVLDAIIKATNIKELPCTEGENNG